MQQKRIVVIGFIGTQLDGGKGSARWEKWRPSVALTQHDDLLVDRFDLLYTGAKFEPLVRQVTQDIAAVSPETRVVAHNLPVGDAWDFEDVYASLFDFAKGYPFDPDNEEYWIHITTGTHVVNNDLKLIQFWRSQRFKTDTPPSPARAGFSLSSQPVRRSCRHGCPEQCRPAAGA